MPLTRLVPMLPVSQLARSIAFYEMLGFAVQDRWDVQGWAMLRSGAGELMLDQSINHPPDAMRTSVLYLYPDDIAAYHREVRERGLAVPDLEITFYGMTEFRLADPDGNRLWIGQARRSSGASG
jgi:catechol 2,3-dioxygenase-like lactoylglutathione lyase family enzyme